MNGCFRNTAAALLMLAAGLATAAPAAAPASAAAASAATATAVPAPVDSAPGLRHDPFRRPKFGPDGVILARESDDRPDAGPAVIEPPPWTPQLRGVMLAGANSIANVDGTTVRVGETIDGWRLLRVADSQAWFSKAGRQTTLTMNNATVRR